MPDCPLKKGSDPFSLARLILVAVALAMALLSCEGRNPAEETELANPAAEYCVQKGGEHSIQTGEDGGQQGLCTFEGRRQCDEWAMFRGECPVGGLITDPFAYCQDVANSGIVTAADTGGAFPETLLAIMRDEGVVSDEMPAAIQAAAEWRCMDGNVWVCTVGANLPCSEKADLSKTASAAMRDYCHANPDSESIPVVFTGRATVYAWRCEGDSPGIKRQVFSADTQGFLAEFWTALPVPATQ